METKKSLQSRVMSLAWKLFRKYPEKSFSHWLTISWSSLRKVNYRPVINNVLKMLSFVSVNKTIIDSDNNKVEFKGTSDFWKISNKKEIRKSTDPDVQEMVYYGLIPLGDIINKRRRDKIRFTPRLQKVKRPRIIKSNFYGPSSFNQPSSI